MRIPLIRHPRLGVMFALGAIAPQQALSDFIMRHLLRRPATSTIRTLTDVVTALGGQGNDKPTRSEYTEKREEVRPG